MKKLLFNLSIVFATFVIVAFSLAIGVDAYPQNQYQECILAVKSNPVVVGIPEVALGSFCDCALRAIIDDGNNNENSAKQCAKETLNN